MDCRTGEIVSQESLRGKSKEEKRHFVPLSEDLAAELMPLGGTGRKNYMRNKPCPCGSKKKFKRCCWSRYS